MRTKQRRTVLVAEDDPDDQYLIRSAIGFAGMDINLVCVGDGRSVVDYLLRSAETKEPLPDIILLDLNMSIMDGKQTLDWVKRSEAYTHVPVIIYTTSRSERDVKDCYALGANSYIVKPVSFADIERSLKSLCDYWLQVVELSA